MDYQFTFTDSTKPIFVVKPYTANGPKEPGAPTPLFSSAVSANTSLILLGKGAFDYGEPVQKNFVHLLENFANKTRPSYPIQGQLWYKSDDAADPVWPTDPVKKGLYVYNGTMWTQIVSGGAALQGDLDAGTHRVINVADAQAATDALNVQTGDYRYINITGDAMSGTLNMTTNRITNVGDAVDYFDAVSMSFGDSRYLRTVGGQMLGTIDMNNNRIMNVTDPVAQQDALNLRSAKALFIQAGAGGSVDGGTY